MILADKSATSADHVLIMLFRKGPFMNETTLHPRLAGKEHWTAKGEVKLFLWNKCAGDPATAKATILFVHGSSMASQPTFDLDVPGRPDSSAMEFFARRGYDTWSVDMEGYGRSTKTRDNNAPIAYGAEDCYCAATYIQGLRGRRPLLVYGISSGALRAALFAQNHPGMVARLALDAMVWTGKGSPTLAERAKKLPEFRAKNRRPIDRAFVHSIFNRDHPGSAEDKVVDAFADAILALDDSIPNGTYVDMCANLPVCDPTKITVPDHRHARTVGRHRQHRGPPGVLQAAAQSGQAVHGHAGHLACELPGQELRARFARPAELLLAAGSGVSGVMTAPPPQLPISWTSNYLTSCGSSRPNRRWPTLSGSSST